MSIRSLPEHTNMYILDPGESKQVEAIPHDYGLKVGVVYDAKSEGQVLMYQRWGCKNESVLTVTFMNGGDISTFGGQFNRYIIKLDALMESQR